MMISLSKWDSDKAVGLPPSLLKLANIPLTAPVEASFSEGMIVFTTTKKRREHIPLKERLKKSGWDGKRCETEVVDWGEPVGREEW